MNQKITKEDILLLKKYYGFTYNDIFRHVLASDDEQSKTILKTLISQIVHKEIISVHIGNTEPIKENYCEKGMRLDVFVTCIDEYGNHRKIDLEIQNYGTSDYLASRAMAYKAKMITSQLKAGDETYAFDEVYQVMILDKVRFVNNNRYYHEYCLMDIDEKVLFPNNKEHVVMIELEKMNLLDVHNIKSWSPLDKMSYLMKYAHDESKRDIIKVLEEEHEVLKMMLDKKEDFFNNPDENFIRYREMRARIDEDNKDVIIKQQWIEEGIEKGIEKGRAQEREESKKNNVLNMHKLGLSLEQISLYLNIPMNEVKEYINE